LAGGAATYTPDKDFVVSLCQEAGRIMLEGFGHAHNVAHKGAVDLVTEVDLALEEKIGEAILRRFPEHSVFSEERWREDDARHAEYIWLVDPLDGTTNYVHGYPMFCVSVALVQREDVLLGCVYDPLHEELFYAEKGGGATVNGRKISVSSASNLISSLLSTGFPYERASGAENNVAELGRLINRIQGVRRSGSLALDLAYVAAGRLDGHWELNVKPWDTAAGGLLVTEAGGRMSDVRGETWSPFHKDVAASNGKIHKELLVVLQQHE
jgi:myo-inositol-1(or 4)-monophosphatase